jgi:hypothetical protein
MLGMISKSHLLGFVLILLLAACDAFNQNGVPSPIYVTATSQQFIIVTNTPSPSPSPVLAPTLPGGVEAGQRPTASPTLAVTLTPAITNTPTFTPTPTDTPVTPGAIILPVGGAASSEIGSCQTTPSGGFGEIYTGNPELAAQIGCPLDTAALSISSAYQTYERGIMMWVSAVGASGASGIYAIYNNGSYQRFNDTWVEGVDPVSIGAAPPPGLVEPIRGFGKVWRESPGVSDTLGWANSAEQGGNAFVQTFERGEMIYVPQNGQTYILVSGQPGTWTSLAQPF